jgi:exportin-5
MASNTTSATLPNLIEALRAIHDPRTPNDVRHSASSFLESSKTDPQAPDWGYALASDTSQPPEVRHMGLKLLEHGLRYGFTSAGAEAATTEDETVRQLADYETEARRLREVRGWVERLAGGVGNGEPAFVRNKIAQLWVEVAKRLWGGEEEGWSGMDAGLVALWEGRAPSVSNGGGGQTPPAANEAPGDRLEKVQMVLEILETLSEDVFNRDDAAVQTRGSELGKACVDVFIPAEVLAREFPERDAAYNGISMRSGEQGWITRIAELLQWCLGPGGGLQGGASGREAERVADTVVKALAALKAAVGWVMPKALAATNIVSAIARGLAVPVVTVQLVGCNAFLVPSSIARLTRETGIGGVSPRSLHSRLAR